MKTWKTVLLTVVALGIIAALLVYFLVYNKPHPDYATMDPDMELPAEQLYRDFVNDEQRAHERYNGKVLQVQGQLAEVEQVDDMVILSFVFEEGMFGGEGVRCTMLESYKEEALSLAVGTHVTVKGFCTGFTGSDVILEHSSIP